MLSPIPEDSVFRKSRETEPSQKVHLPAELLKAMNRFQACPTTRKSHEPTVSEPQAVQKLLPPDLLKVMERLERQPPGVGQRRSSAGSAA